MDSGYHHVMKTGCPGHNGTSPNHWALMVVTIPYKDNGIIVTYLLDIVEVAESHMGFLQRHSRKSLKNVTFVKRQFDISKCKKLETKVAKKEKAKKNNSSNEAGEEVDVAGPDEVQVPETDGLCEVQEMAKGEEEEEEEEEKEEEKEKDEEKEKEEEEKEKEEKEDMEKGVEKDNNNGWFDEREQMLSEELKELS
ncbi:hypothetical protein C0995_012549 [Termitomyces sp. Mi166|nr:hypothetical protein C0995_012549 [Termitomyces sp. Mi166\